MSAIPDSICPHAVLHSQDIAAAELMKAIIVRSNFIPGTRYQLGWRGIKDCCYSSDAWTMKIADYSGVFGIRCKKVITEGSRSIGIFPISYFPHPEEDLVEKFSLQAGIVTQLENYYPLLREFVQHNELREIFTIGTIHLSVTTDGNGCCLGLSSSTRLAAVAIDGVTSTLGTEPVQVVKPGGYDQDIPAWNLAYAFFRVLAASTSYCIERPPAALQQFTRRGHFIHFTEAGTFYSMPTAANEDHCLELTYGAHSVSGLLQNERSIWPEYPAIDWKFDQKKPAQYENEQWWSCKPETQSATTGLSTTIVANKPRLIVLTGFLGSGKTSFLREFIEYQVARNQFIAVIQNEIGKQGLDGKLLGQEYAVTEVDEGCVCCSLVGSVKTAVMDLTSTYKPDYIVLETTGLANPANLLSEIAELEDLVVFDSVTTVFDAASGTQCLKEYEVARSQLAMADSILLNKTDLVTEKELAALYTQIKTINPQAPIIETVHGDVHPNMVFEDGSPSQNVKKKKMPLLLSDFRNHTHDHMSSVSVPIPERLRREEFEEWIQVLPENVYRLKGSLQFSNEGTSNVIQYVAGRYDIAECPSEGMSDFLIAIGKNINEINLQIAK